MKELQGDSFKISNQMIKRFKFKLANGDEEPTNDEDPSNVKYDEHQSLGNSFEIQESKVEKGGIGKIIIQKMKTIRLSDTEEISIDYILFWLSNEGLKRIENLVNNQLLTEVNEIMDQSTNLEEVNKLEFIQRMDTFQNHYIAAQNAKESKSAYFMKIIQSDLPSIEFRYVASPDLNISTIINRLHRYLIRHLTSRMSNLESTAKIIERKFELARNTFQTAIDANLTEYSKKLDQIMRKFAIAATMFIPLQLISGMWGMN